MRKVTIIITVLFFSLSACAYRPTTTQVRISFTRPTARSPELIIKGNTPTRSNKAAVCAERLLLLQSAGSPCDQPAKPIVAGGDDSTTLIFGVVVAVVLVGGMIIGFSGGVFGD